MQVIYRQKQTLALIKVKVLLLDTAVVPNSGRGRTHTWFPVHFITINRTQKPKSQARLVHQIQKEISQKKLCIIKCIIKIRDQVTTHWTKRDKVSKVKSHQWDHNQKHFSLVDQIEDQSTKRKSLLYHLQARTKRDWTWISQANLQSKLTCRSW